MPLPRASEPTRAMRWAMIGAGAAVFLMLIGALASTGGPHGPLAGVAAVLEVTVRAGAPALAYLAGAVGIGGLLRPLYRTAREPWAIQSGLGLGLMLSLSHLLGMAGALRGTTGMVVGGGVVLLGLVLLARQMAGAVQAQGARLPLAAAAGLPALALLLVAASNPPGWLWESEGRGYDALEYHLQLPQEWMAQGRLWPLAHNVYSFLPGYIEAAFLHMAAMMGAPANGGPGAPAGLLAGDGMGVLSTQFLHAGIAVLGAVLVARLVVAAARRAGTDEGPASRAGAAAGAVFLSIPWVIVTGSMPYNDLGVAALLAAALIAAMDAGLVPERRGLIVGLLIGAACGVKPTAIFFGTIPAAVVLAGCVPARRWPAVFGAGAGAGLLMLAPWMIRNAIAMPTGNPVFPAMAEWFGAGHWTGEQVERYAAAHRFAGSWVDRLRLMVMVDSADPAGARHRGLMHPQWSLFFPLVVVSGVAALWSGHRRVAVLLWAGLAGQLGAWLVATHIQSRFLIPLAVPGAAMVGLAAAGAWERSARLGRAAIGAGAAAALAMAAHAAAIFSEQGRPGPGEPAQPNAFLVPGVQAMTGEDLRSAIAAMPRGRFEEVLGQLGPRHLVNLALPAGSRVYLLGDGTPFYFTAPVVYATTYDASPLAIAMRGRPGEPESWWKASGALGATHVLVNFAELSRLERSGFLDPALRPEAIQSWVAGHTRIVREWPELGVVLVEPPEAKP